MTAPRMRARQARELLWPWIEENYPEIWDDPESPLLKDHAVWDAAVDFLRTKRFITNPYVVALWLSDTHRFDPFPDHVAIERAYHFHPGSFAALTDYERTLVVDKFAALEFFTGKSGGSSVLDPVRARAWEELDDATRNNLATIVSKRRQRIKGINT